MEYKSPNPVPITTDPTFIYQIVLFHGEITLGQIFRIRHNGYSFNINTGSCGYSDGNCGKLLSSL